MTGATRVHGPGWREAIGIAVSVVGPTMMARLPHVQFVCGVDPLFAGVHRYATSRAYAVSYREAAHCCYPRHLAGPTDRRVTTIVMPVDHGSWTAHTLVHELGHAIDETLDFHHTAAPVTAYAHTNRAEAFAEAFTAWRWPGNGYAHPDPATMHLLRSLVDGSEIFDGLGNI